MRSWVRVGFALANVAIHIPLASGQEQGKRGRINLNAERVRRLTFQFPQTGSIVSGRVQLKAVADDLIPVVKVSFYYAGPKGQLRLIGTDTDGADDVFNVDCHESDASDY